MGEYKRLHVVYFSPSGTTRAVARTFAQGAALEALEHDLLLDHTGESVSFEAGDVAAFFLPVFAGRIPAVCADALKHFRGSGLPAVAAVVFGNRAFDDALLELQDALTGRGFVVFAAAAFVAQHSIFPEVAHGRPDDEDKRRIA